MLADHPWSARVEPGMSTLTPCCDQPQSRHMGIAWSMMKSSAFQLAGLYKPEDRIAPPIIDPIMPGERLDEGLQRTIDQMNRLAQWMNEQAQK